ncbi:MAG: dTDP-glucose 4,6-dehydratase [Methanobacteriota archaeon]
MRFLVTGGAGFIGSNLVHHLAHVHAGVDASRCCPDHDEYDSVGDLPDLRIHNVDKLTYAGRARHLAGVDGWSGHSFAKVDVCDAEAIEKEFAAFEPDVVLHLAAESHVDRSIADGRVFVDTNVVGTQVLLDAARRHDVPGFLHVSTDEVYGSIREGSFPESKTYDPASPYAASKAASDLLALAHHKTYGLPVAVTRCTNNYGPRQHPEKLLPKTITRAMRDEKIPIYGDGTNVRDWLYVKDHCEALDLLARKEPWGEVYNVAGRAELPNLEVVGRVLRALGKPNSLVEFVPDRPGHDFRYSLDDSKLRGLGWKPRMPFATGLSHTIRYLHDHEVSE